MMKGFIWRPMKNLQQQLLCLSGIIFLFFSVVNCSIKPGRYDNHYSNVTNYPVKIDRHTPSGIGIDDPDLLLSTGLVEQKALQLQDCLEKLATKADLHRIQLTREEAIAGQCLSMQIPVYIKFDYIQVKLAPDWYTSTCTGQQLFPCSIDPKYCTEKKELDELSCACNCRSATQDNKTIIITPNLYLYKAELLRLMSGCNIIWNIPEFVNCVNE